ncbi:MAG: hypothetical protein Q8Q65_04755 [bacterium]|nr:hypothetical protein [bacterium]
MDETSEASVTLASTETDLTSPEGVTVTHPSQNQELGMSRRKVLIAGSILAGTAIANYFEAPRAVINAAGGVPPHGRELLPQSPEYAQISRETSDSLFHDLNPSRFSSDALNEDSFFRLNEWLTKLSLFYFSKDPFKHQPEFDSHHQNFISKINQTSQELDIGLPQVLLGFRTSSRNIGGRGKYNSDVWTEFKIEAANRLAMFWSRGKHSEDQRERALITIWKTTDSFQNHFGNPKDMETDDIPRVMGPRTFGIHDQESIQIARALAYCNRNSSWFQKQIAQYGLDPEIAQTIQLYDHLAQTKQETDRLIEQSFLETTPEIESLRKLFNSPNFIRSMITDPKNRNLISPWQLTRTTKTWASLVINEAGDKDNIYNSDNITSIDNTVNWYTSEEATQNNLFLQHQLTNPQLRSYIQEQLSQPSIPDTQRAFLKSLLRASNKIISLSEQSLLSNRNLDEKLIDLELDQSFQVLSGVAYIKYLYELNRPNLKEADYLDKTSLNQLTYSHLMYGSHRDIGNVDLLAERSYITPADLPYVPKDTVTALFHEISQQFKEETGKPPDSNYEDLLEFLRDKHELSDLRVTIGGKQTLNRRNKTIKDLMGSVATQSGLLDLESIYEIGLRH